MCPGPQEPRQLGPGTQRMAHPVWAPSETEGLPREHKTPWGERHYMQDFM